MTSKPSPSGGNQLTAEQASKGGKNGKRGPSVKKQMEKLLDGEVPADLIKFIESKQGSVLVKEHGAAAVAWAIFAMGMIGDGQMLRWMGEQQDGKAGQSIKHSGSIGMTAEDLGKIMDEAIKKK